MPVALVAGFLLSPYQSVLGSLAACSSRFCCCSPMLVLAWSASFCPCWAACWAAFLSLSFHEPLPAGAGAAVSTVPGSGCTPASGPAATGGGGGGGGAATGAAGGGSGSDT